METGGGKARGTGEGVMNVDEALKKIWIWERLY